MKTKVMTRQAFEEKQELARPSVFDGEKIAQARAEGQIRKGKKLVVAGFIVAVFGIVLYCAVCFTAGVHLELSAILLGHLGLITGATLVIIGAGTLLWLVGSVMYMNGAMDTNTETTF